MKIKQLSVFVENKPGAVSKILKLLADNGINIATLSLADAKEFGVLRLLIRDWADAIALLEKNGYVVNQTDVVAIRIDHEAGSLSKVLDVLDRNDVNVEYLYAFAAGFLDKAVIIFRFDNPDLAIEKIKAELPIVDPVNLFKPKQ